MRYNNLTSQGLTWDRKNIVIILDASIGFFCRLSVNSHIIPLIGTAQTRHRSRMHKVYSTRCRILKHWVTFIYLILLLSGVLPLMLMTIK